jgi:hypothetical protein
LVSENRQLDTLNLYFDSREQPPTTVYSPYPKYLVELCIERLYREKHKFIASANIFSRKKFIEIFVRSKHPFTWSIVVDMKYSEKSRMWIKIQATTAVFPFSQSFMRNLKKLFHVLTALGYSKVWLSLPFSLPHHNVRTFEFLTSILKRKKF